MYFIGVTRFSLFNPGSSAWKISKMTQEEYLEKLYSDDRLKIRFDIFFNKALPIYKIMSKDYFYKHVIQYSSLMPTYWKNKLKEEASKYDFLILSESDANIKSVPVVDILKEQVSGTLAYFRVDDDDLLSKNYLKSLSYYSTDAYEGMIISFGKGSIALYDKDRYIDFRKCHRRFLALGMAFIGRYDSTSKSYWLPRAGSHEKVDRYSPVIIDSREDMYVWTQNVLQDTKHNLKDVNNYVNSLINQFEPNVETSQLIDLFPTIANDIIDIQQSRKMLVSYKNPSFLANEINIPVEFDEIARRYILNYELLADLSINDKKALTLSLVFEENTEDVSGLYLSPNIDVGWYSYIDIQNGVGKKSILITLRHPNKLVSVKLKRNNIGKEIVIDIRLLELIKTI